MPAITVLFISVKAIAPLYLGHVSFIPNRAPTGRKLNTNCNSLFGVGARLNVDGLKMDFNGDFNDFSVYNKAGVHRYHLGTSSAVNGPSSVVYGVMDVSIRTPYNEKGLNVCVQKVYDNNNHMNMRISSRISSAQIGEWTYGEWEMIY